MSKPKRDFEGVLRQLDIIRAAKSRNGHPLWLALMNGRASRWQVAEFLKQFVVMSLYNHFCHGPL